MLEPSAYYQIGTSVIAKYGDGQIVGVEDFMHSDCACGCASRVTRTGIPTLSLSL